MCLLGFVERLETVVSQIRIGLRDVRKLKKGQVIWDAAVPGFGARRQKGDAVTYVLIFRAREGRQRWHTIGRHGAPWTPDMARVEAKKLLHEVAEGSDPAADKRAKRKAATVGELCDRYIADASSGRLLTRRKTAKKASTLATDHGRIERHIKPLLGRMSVAAVSREDVDSFMHAVAAERRLAGTCTEKKARSSERAACSTGDPYGRSAGGHLFMPCAIVCAPDNPVHGVVRSPTAAR